jgi:ABC-type glycerol-3-phosphate transport system substrate-binding protein
MKTIHGNIRARLMISRFFRMLAVLFLAAAALTGPLASCLKPNDISFPTLGTTAASATQPSEPSGNQTSEPNGIRRLTVALPFGDEALEAIRLLFLAKKSGLLNQEPGQYIGQQINPEDLRQFDGPLDITLEAVPLTTGATLIQVSTWQASAMLPDIIYCQDAVTSLGLDQILVLDDLLYANPLLAATHIYAQLLESGRISHKLCCIPYLASTPLIYLNQGLISQLELASPDLDWTWQEWYDFSAAAQQAISKVERAATPEALAALVTDTGEPDLEAVAALLKQALFVTDNPAGLLPYLPASLSLSAGYAMWDGSAFQWKAPSFKTAGKKLAEYVKQGFSTLHLDPAQLETTFGNGGINTERLSGRLLMWTGDSSELNYWHQQPGLSLAERFLPISSAWEQTGQTDQGASTADNDPDESRLPVTVRSLFISRQCQEPELAAEFAAFVALDADSLLLQNRYQQYEGLFPAIQDKVVWDALVGRQLLGNRLVALRDRMPYVYCSGQQKVPDWQKIMMILQTDIGPRLLLANEDSQFDELLAELITKIG